MYLHRNIYLGYKPITFLNKTLTSSEQNYSIHDCRIYAIVAYCKAWHPYIDGQCAMVITDKNPLINLHTQLLLIKKKSDGLRSLLAPQFKSSCGLVLPLWLLASYLSVSSKTDFAAAHTLLHHPLQCLTPFWLKNLS